MSAVIVEYCRTPIGKLGGALAWRRADDLAALVIKEVVQRSGISPAIIEDVILGCANQAGEDNRNVARMSGLLAGLPVEVPGVTVNRLCASGLQAVMDAALRIKSGWASCIVAGGVENMSRAPWVMKKPERGFTTGNPEVFDTTLGWRFTNPRLAKMHHPFSMGETAENVAERMQISREAQDDYAVLSQQRWKQAQDRGDFQNEIVKLGAEGKLPGCEIDEHPRPETSLEMLKGLKPVFREKGSVTAGNSSGLNDGAAALVIMSEEMARKKGLPILARIVAATAVGLDPAVMGLGPVTAIERVLKMTNTSLKDVDLIEINEAFSVQVLGCLESLKLSKNQVNTNGGAIAMGHPLGMSGARIVGTLAKRISRGEGSRAIASLCVGVGQGMAMLIEKE